MAQHAAYQSLCMRSLCARLKIAAPETPGELDCEQLASDFLAYGDSDIYSDPDAAQAPDPTALAESMGVQVDVLM